MIEIILALLIILIILVGFVLVLLILYMMKGLSLTEPTMKTRKIITDHSKPTSQEDTKINYNTGTIGDDPTKSAELKASQEAEDKEKADKKLRDELEEIMKTRIAEQGKALADTFAEIMRGPVPDKKEEQKKDVKSNG